MKILENNMEEKLNVTKFLSSYTKNVEKIEGVSTDNSPPAWWLSSGNYVLNYLSSGNFESFIPQGRITGIFGASAAGKSFLVNTIVKTALDSGFICVPLDSEEAWDDNSARKIGIDPDNPLYIPLELNSIEKCQKTISKFLTDYKDEYGDVDVPLTHVSTIYCVGNFLFCFSSFFLILISISISVIHVAAVYPKQ